MKRYIQVYKRLMKINLASLLAYRANFVNNLISSIMWSSFHIISIYLLTSRTSHIYGWTRNELMMLSGMYLTMSGLFHLIFSINFDRFAKAIDYGQIDIILLKPLDSQFMMSCWYINYPSIFRIIVGTSFTLWMAYSAGYNPGLLEIIGAALVLLIGLIILYSIWFLATTIIIWVPRLTNIVEFMFTFTGTTRYPPEIFKELKYFVFLFMLPITLIVSTPVRTLVQKVTLVDIFVLITLSIVLFILSRIFWKFALRFYTSASG